MKLEEEIQQSSFRNDYHKLLVNIIYTSGWINDQQQRLFKPYGISAQQFNVLRILRGRHPEPATVSIIMDRMLDKMSNASRLVEKLKQKGYVSRETSLHDRRQVDVGITEEGLDLLKKLDAEVLKLEDIAMKLPLQDVQRLNDLLDSFRD